MRMRVPALRSLSLFATGALVAKAWEGSAAAAAWRAGYHPMGEVVRLPRGGLRSQDDKRAFFDHDFVLCPGAGARR
ncbi:hypothetical protein CQW39_35715 [Streptomyces griseofuscus]|uniref:Uncharacterized protein n=1 Tax=Streptomyces griseofuscus TaxID=146922 RepID=A0A3R8Q4R7_9ACTN|nr:hypothetical protein CQW39_35715 [Streptomyces griseofuscus]RRQ78450.1 hypothetical protein CQW44_36700 [Streptomyces griseofuscus]